MSSDAEQERIVTAAVLVIGDEILSGRTKDKNIGAISEHLSDIGIEVREVRIVPDDEADIVAAVNALRGRFTYVFTTGGIGPTHDDITADAVARAFGVRIGVDERAAALLTSYFEGRGLELTPARARMARIPEGANLIRNTVSAAPGFMIGNVIVMAGVPAIMQAMLDEVTRNLATGRKILSTTIDVARPESEIAAIFSTHQNEFPDVRMGSYPQVCDGRFVTQLVLRAVDAKRLAAATKSLEVKLAALS